MADKPKKESTEQEEPQAEEVPAEGADASAAGPVAEDGPPAAPEDASSTPPAEEEAEPAAEAPPPEKAPAESDDVPWKERRRLERSRRSHDGRPQRSAEERAAEQRDARRAKAVARSRYRHAQRAKGGEPRSGTPAAERRPNPAKVRQGIVVSDKPDKTITVRIDIARRHPAYEKIVRRSRTLHAHDERNEAGEGDTVRIVETRPLSRLKRWRLLDVVEKAK